jgi:hypothetical protein
MNRLVKVGATFLGFIVMWASHLPDYALTDPSPIGRFIAFLVGACFALYGIFKK